MPRPDLQPLPLSDADLDALSQITEADILAAHQAFVNAADERYKNLLLAQPEDLEDADNPDDNA